jgi:acetylornithine deacetylase/succinyl-diaminopimelate desuccinylase-like protein
MTGHVPLLADLIRRPSVNPMGRDVSGPEYLEGRVTDFLVQRFTELGLPWARQPVAPGRDNVVVRLDATVPRAPVILWDAHQDTVPVENMTVEPFVPVVHDGRMFGRGACDVKGGMAAMVAAFERLLTHTGRRDATVVFSATVNEEFGFSGARALSRLWQSTAPDAPATDTAARKVIGRRPTMAIVAEPTALDLVMQHKGAIRWRIRVHGRACHSAFPEQGSNAIYPAGRVILALEALACDLLTRHADHPCGPPTLNLGTIRGGAGVNLVPDLTIMEVERRVLPGESPHDARAEAIARIAAACGDARIEHDEPFLESAGLADATGDPKAAPWVERLAAAARARGATAARTAARYGTNASVFTAQGVPSVVFGPGSIAQAHTADEWIDLAQVGVAAEILAALVTGG